MSKKICVIVGGAQIKDYEAVRASVLSYADSVQSKAGFSNDTAETGIFTIFCDCGFRHAKGLGLKPDLIVGDFDSSSDPGLDVETIVLPRQKDDTDTFFAAKEALRRGFDEFILVGVIGERFDHSLGNISILLYIYKNKKHGIIIDDHSQMQIVGKDPVFIDECCGYFSLLCVNGTARGVYISNAKYPLEGKDIFPEFQYGISNEVIPGQIAKVYAKEGLLLLVKVNRTDDPA